MSANSPKTRSRRVAAATDEKAEYDWEAFKALVAADLTSLQYPEEYGGQGAPLVTQAIATEELARACASTSLMFLISKLGMLPVINFGSDGVKAEVLPRVCDGSSQASYCLSEADAGSDVASMTTRAVRDGDDWVLNGTKCWITNAGISDLYTVFARTSDDRHKGITCFLAKAEWGVHVDKLEHKLGIKGSPTGVVRFADCRVPDARRHRRSRPRLRHRDAHARPQPPDDRRAGCGHRSGRARLRDRLHEGASHVRPPARRQPGPAMDGSRLRDANRGGARLVYRACAMVDDGDPTGELGMAGAMAKCFASDVAMQVTTDCVQFLGGYGYTNEFPVERMMRDAKITQIYEGTNQIQTHRDRQEAVQLAFSVHLVLSCVALFGGCP